MSSARSYTIFTGFPDFHASSAACAAIIEGYSSFPPKIFFFSAKAAAGFRLDHANFLRREAEQGDQSFVHVVRALQRTPDSHSLAQICGRDHALILDVQVFLRAGPKFAFDDEVGARPRGIYVPLFHVVRLEDVVLARNDGVLRERILDREDGGQRVNVDLYRAPRFLEKILVRVSQQDDRLLGVVDELVREARLIVRDRGNFIFAWNILGGDDRELAPGDSAAIADAADASSRDTAAHGHAVDHSRKGEVIHILGAAGYFVPPFFPDDGMSNLFFFHPCRPRASVHAFARSIPDAIVFLSPLAKWL